MTFLHTWDQKILDHFHIHCIIPVGALCKSGKKWIDCNYDFLFPEQALARVFRGKFKDYVGRYTHRVATPTIASWIFPMEKSPFPTKTEKKQPGKP
jgi:hypothetical protein